ncbi:MAG: hypothetical protein IKT27_05135 [Clostridia bacterium]|nr:hypothetical protein [Clostridia bacterium]
MTEKRKKIYEILITALCIAIMSLCAYMGITAVQRSMNMKVGVNITPSHEIRIDYGGETIFCNTTKDSIGIKVANGYTLSGNKLTFTQEFLSIGQTFALTIYNYNTSYLQVSVSGTGVSGNTITIDPYSTNAPSEVLNLTISAGVTNAVLSFSVPVTYSLSYSGENYTYSGKSSVIEGNSYSTTFSASEYYNLPNTITITMGGESLTSGFTYTKTSDTSAALTINAITGDVEITCMVTGDVVQVAIELYVTNESKTFTANSTITYPSNSCSVSFQTGLAFIKYPSLSSSTCNTTYVNGFYSSLSLSKYQTGSNMGGIKDQINMTVYINWGDVAESINVSESCTFRSTM